MIFQVKYAREPNSIDDPREWVLAAVRKELPKIRELAKLGAQHYRLITNVRGSGDLRTGSIDRLDDALSKIPIPADGWWRDDLLGRLDSSWDIKWAFPELFTGPDLLRALIEEGLSDDRARRSSAISTFLADQYDADARVKFKQVELENNLLDLYVDVEMTGGHHLEDRYHGLTADVIYLDQGNGHFTQAYRTETGEYTFSDPSTGSASFLLAEPSPATPPWLVLEGAPGQGKSTVTQYLCQIHRMRLLHNADDLAKVDPVHLEGPLRLPFRVDLRDLAAWLHGRNPFSSTQGASLTPKRSVETFLAAQVENASGGAQFSVADLHAVTRVSSLLLVFDGLDEVADIGERERVVSEVSAALRRLRQIAASLQALVTSRPAAFENSPGFATDTFAYYKLTDLSSDMISRYATKWLSARRLRSREASDVLSVLSAKLDQPHMRDLARNPMQLAILLSLIHRRGPSLPDKRTALYDSYINTFFDREAEKTDEVQRNRDLLVEIHQYLAWRLQGEVETGNSQGTITERALRRLLTDYLEDEEKDSGLVPVLFKSLVERVVAIVSRVQGTYEFEVRPLQEYFAARYLYDTAHHSSPGCERAGDKTDRFDALARNFYWLNVTRFYAGCYSKGELPSLAECLQGLANEPQLHYTDHPRLMSVMLLSDWVFAQHPRSVKNVMQIVLRDFGARGINSTRDPLGLPIGSGRDELAALCWKLADAAPKSDRARSIIATLATNSNDDEIDTAWLRRLWAARGAQRTTWARYGLWLGALDRASPDTVTDLVEDPSCDALRLSVIVDSSHQAAVDENAEWLSIYVDGLVDGEISLPFRSGLQNQATVTGVLAYLFSSLPQVGASDHWLPKSHEDRTVSTSAALHDCERFIACVAALDTSPGAWMTSLGPWNSVVECLRCIWGDRWLAIEIANTAAGIHAAGERGKLGDGLFDPAVALCERIRYARLRAGAGKWWSSQLDSATTEFDKLLAVTVFFSWAGEKTIISQVGKFDAWVQHASVDARTLVRRAIERCGIPSFRGERSVSFLDARVIPDDVSPSTIVLLMARTTPSEAQMLAERFLFAYSGDDRMVLEALVNTRLREANEDSAKWGEALEVIRHGYASDVIGQRVFTSYNRFNLRHVPAAMPYQTAKDVIDDAASYPLSVVALAEARCREGVGASVVPLAEVAEVDGW